MGICKTKLNLQRATCLLTATWLHYRIAGTMKQFIIVLLFTIVKSDGVDNTEKTKEAKLKYTRPESPPEFVNFAESFHSQEEFQTRWIKSQAKKDNVDASISKYDGVWELKEPKENPLEGDQGLVFSSNAKHGAIASMLSKPFQFEDKPLMVQYEVKFQNKHECGGAYIKLLAETPSFNIKEFTDKTLYSIMFGPDKCGSDGKLHFIFQHENPITKKMEEKHAKKPSGDFGHIFDDGKTHLVTLFVQPDNSFKILIDQITVNDGSLLSDVEPPVNPSQKIDDPEDKKPEDWDEREKIPDLQATKPDDWDEEAPKTIPDPSATKPAEWLDDEPALIPDPQAVQPEDWDEEEDGEWEAPQINNPKCKAVGCGEWRAPMIKNPNYKGKWSPPLIDNPKYKGVWAPRKIDNPDYYEDRNPFAMKPIVAVGFELWSMQSDILFDNIIITGDESALVQWTMQTWDLKHSKEVANTPSVVGSMMNDFLTAANEKPWLYVIAAIAVLLPIVLLYIFCCSGRKDDVSRRKKTDEPHPDDSASIEEDEEEVKEEDGANSEEINKVGENTTEDAKDNIAGKKETAEEKADSQDDGQEEEKADSEDVQISSSPRTRSRRKTRKDD